MLLLLRNVGLRECGIKLGQYLARLYHLAIDGFTRRPMAHARQMLGENRGESGRHMLRDEHRKPVDHRPDFADEAHERLRTARR